MAQIVKKAKQVKPVVIYSSNCCKGCKLSGKNCGRECVKDCKGSMAVECSTLEAYRCSFHSPVI